LTPLVSVLIPFKNSGQYIGECIQSILRGTFTDFEMLLIDDFSSDNSSEIAKVFSQNDSRISIYSTEIPGMTHALNKGLNLSKGQYVARMDSDDISHPERLKKQVDELLESPQIVLTSSLVECFGEDKLTEGFHKYIKWVNGCVTSSQIAEGLFIESPLPHPSVMFRRAPVMKLGGYKDYQGPEDFDLWIRLVENGYSFSKLPEVLLKWRMYSTSYSKTDARYKQEFIEKRKREHVLYVLKNGSINKKNLFIMGAGKKGGKLGRYLLDNGLPLKGFIDIDPKKQNKSRHGLPVTSLEDFFENGNDEFILGYVTAWGAREIILKQLLDTGRVRGKDFIIL